ncbi:hypothetical protein ACOMHN_061152 [Nucella lapillus]
MSELGPAVKICHLLMTVTIPTLLLVWRGADCRDLRRRRGSTCAWDQYYDPNMDDCGPCHEICDSMKLTRTEQQCRNQCSDYLVSLSCRADQYFDEMVRSCAPCSELCSQGDAKGTTKECSRKCRKYLETSQPGNTQAQVLDLVKAGNGYDPSSSSSPSTSPWLHVTIAIGIGVIVLAIVFALLFHYHHKRRQHRNYLSAPGNDVPGLPASGSNGVGHGDTSAIAMQVLTQPALPVQVSSEGFAAGDFSLQRLVPSEDTQPKTVEVGIAECDPMAPSSAAYHFVLRQQDCC